MQKPIWLFGGIAGVLCALLEYLFYSGQNFDSKSMYLVKIAILLICIIFGLILIRKLLGGTISIGRTILSGVLIATVKSVVTIIAFLALYAPHGEFYENHLSKAKKEAVEIISQDKEVAQQDKAAKIKEAEHFISGQFQPLGYSISTLIEGWVTGFVISVLMAAFIATNMMYKQE